MNAVLSLLNLEATRIGGFETYARELSVQLAKVGRQSILCFSKPVTGNVREFLQLPNVIFEAVEAPGKLDVQSLLELKRVFRRYRPEILHLHFMPSIGPIPWLARLSGIEKVFLTDHTSRPPLFVPARRAGWKRQLARVMSSPISGVVCVSDYVRRCVVASSYVPQDRVHRVYNAADIGHIDHTGRGAQEFRRKYSIPEGYKIVAQVSSITPEKGIPELLEVARLVVKESANVFFVIAGEGKHRADYTQLSQSMGLQNHVIWTGRLQDPLVDGVYSAADVVCQLSRWEEAFGFVIAEAMACGAPVVATRVGGIPEVVEDGETGLLVEPGDILHAAKAISTLLASPSLRYRMGDNARRSVQEKFNLSKNVAQLVNLYALD